MKFLSIVLLFVLTMSLPAFAGGGGNGGGVRGGGSAKFVKGKWQLKDLLIRNGLKGESYILSNSLRSFLKNTLIPIVDTYSGLKKPEFWKEVLGDSVDIRLVSALPCGPINDEADEFHYGCTLDQVTYLQRENFLKLTTLQKILGIIHQRGHAYDSSERAHDWIEPFIQGLNTAIEIQLDQESGRFERISGERVQNLTHLLSHDYGASLSNHPNATLFGKSATRTNRRILAQGGGILVTDYSLAENLNWIADDSFVGIGSTVTVRSNACRDPRLSSGLPIIRENSKIIESNLECVVSVSSNFVRTNLVRKKQSGAIVQHNSSAVAAASDFIGSTIMKTNWQSTASFYVLESRLKNISLDSDYSARGTINLSELNGVTLKSNPTLSDLSIPLNARRSIELQNRRLERVRLDF